MWEMNETRQVMSSIDFKSVLHWARMNAPLSGSYIHGEDHWIKVSERGVSLAARTPGADSIVTHLFGFLHDCQRLSEGRDSMHGKRASKHIEKIRNNLLKNLTDTQFEKLKFAIENHNTEQVSKDPTIGCCWDADRLELGRVGIRIEKRYMSTDAGFDVCVMGN